MILAAFLRALGQVADRRFAGVLARGVALTLGLLVVLGWGLLHLARWAMPDTLALPWIGEVGGLDAAASVGTVILLVLASSVLMVPVASAFTGLFLERIAEAVEARHYPALPAPRPQGLAESARGAVGSFAVLLAVNLIALLVWPFTGPFAPLLFWAMNGWLLGREYFTLVALRRLPPDQARALYRDNAAKVWLAGTLMAAPLSVPLVNLVIPVLGAATFTHLFHALAKAR